MRLLHLIDDSLPDTMGTDEASSRRRTSAKTLLSRAWMGNISWLDIASRALRFNPGAALATGTSIIFRLRFENDLILKNLLSPILVMSSTVLCSTEILHHNLTPNWSCVFFFLSRFAITALARIVPSNFVAQDQTLIRGVTQREEHLKCN